jgi:hypothetical protein
MSHLAASLPRLPAGVSVPVAVVLLLAAAFWVAKKLLVLAVVAAVVAGLVVAYQAGAFPTHR